MRLLTRDDYDKYYPLINEFRKTTVSREQFITYMDKLPSNIEIYVTELEGNLITTCTVIFEPKLIFDMCTYAHIEDVCVSSEYRKRGIGTHLMQQVVALCTERDCKKVTLVCNPQNIHFYQLSSFEQRGVQMSILLKE
jgi:N-acetylglutamate synthase-like GNAT family acetyltransferase